MLLILIGLSGSGKNFVGEILAKEFNFHYWDADTDIPQNMREQILKKEDISQIMRDEFTEIIIKKIAKLKKQYPKLAVSQALYKEINRRQIALHHPEAKFIHVISAKKNINDRLKQRNDWVDEVYAEKIRTQFENPSRIDGIVMNNSDVFAIISQLQSLLTL